MKNIIVAIDPGKTGAICAISSDLSICGLFDMPCVKSKTKNEIDLVKIHEMFLKFFSDTSDVKYHFFMERIPAYPTWCSSPKSNWYLGYYTGLFEMLFAITGQRLRMVDVDVWQTYYGYRQRLKGIKKDRGKKIKELSHYLATQYFPTAEVTTARGRLIDGRTDVLLIANYCVNLIKFESKP